MTVPDMEHEYPACGCCHSNSYVHLDGDTWDCNACELMWGLDGSEGKYWGDGSYDPAICKHNGE